MRKQCLGSERRALVSPSLSLIPRLTDSSAWYVYVTGLGGEGMNGAGFRCHRFYSSNPQVRLSPLLFLENTDIAAPPLATTKDLPVEDTVEASGLAGSRQCFLYPGPGGGYGFRLCYVASGPCLFISQVTDVSSCAWESTHHSPPTFLCPPRNLPSLRTPDQHFCVSLYTAR